MDELNYVIAIGAKQPFSVNPSDSDIVSNATLMSHLVGTLTMRSGSGRYELNLADNCQTSADSKVWSFKVRSGLHCEDGTAITASGFKRSLETTIKIYHRQRPNLPVIEDLAGFASFVNGDGKSLSGIIVEGDELKFQFDKPSKSGVLEFLSMPYYGFYSASNFTNEGEWKNSSKIVSSASYKLESINSQLESATLIRRGDWFSNVRGSPERVVLWQKDAQDAARSNFENQIIATLGNALAASEIVDYDLIKAVPEVLIAVTLSPSESSMFADLRNRRYFRKRARLVQKHLRYAFDEADLNPSFYTQYASVEPEDAVSENEFVHLAGRKEIKVYLGRKNQEDEYIRNLIEEVFLGSGLEIKFIYLDTTKQNWLHKHTSNSLYDIRIAGVGAAGFSIG